MSPSDDRPRAGSAIDTNDDGSQEAPSSDPATLVGRVLSGRYRIEALIGEGGMGAVYVAEHELMHKRVAIKVLHAEMTRMPEVVARFEREALAAAHIEHPNVAAATDVGKLDDGSLYLVLEYVEGTSLRDRMADGPLTLGRAAHIAAQIASALGRAHGFGIVHRDLKPENVMLVERDGDPDFVKVLDFGIAKVPIGELAKHGAASKGEVLTQLGMVYGTPEYMAPEQALGENIDHRADLYALGVILFEMLAGQRPFDAESKVALLGQKVSVRAPTLADKRPEATFLPDVEALVARLIEREASLRPKDARAVIESLEELATGSAATIPPGIRFRTGRGAPLLATSSRDASGQSPTGDDAGKSRDDPQYPTGDDPPKSSTEDRGREPSGAGGELGDRLRPWNDALPHVPAQVALTAGAAVLLIAVLAAIGLLRSPGPAVRVIDGGLVTTPLPTPHVLDKPKTASPSELASAVASGPQALVELSERFQDDPAVLRALVHAHADRKNYLEALSSITKLVALDTSAAGEAEVGDVTLAAAQGPPDVADAAFDLMERGLGATGVDLLFELSQTKGMAPRSIARAKQALAKPDVKARASPALSVFMEMKATSSCEARRGLLVRAREVGDTRMLSLLRVMSTTRGCGFLGLADCWSCLRRDGTLGAAMSAIEERGSSGTRASPLPAGSSH